jgi:hypothetical protein
MKIRNKLLLIASPLLLVGATVTTVAAWPATHSTQSVGTKNASSVQQVDASTEVPSAQPSLDTQPAIAPTPAVVTQATQEQTKYGEDPNNPGVFIVFDKASVMASAGIGSDQQPAADTLITKMMQWRYKQTAFPESDLCYVVPTSKMAVAGADYRDNPVTQLKYCNTLVVARYGTWDAALAQYKGSGGF